MLKPGDLVGPYEIRGFVGQGGMGQVYRAFDPRLERTVALKVIAPAFQDLPATKDSRDAPIGSSPRLSGDGHARLLREARAVASLSHPNVVNIFDVGESNGRLYLAMEYVVGSTLRSLVGQEGLPTSRKIRWLVEVARALHAAHLAGLVHRDVKPENVMIREDGGVKVLDFGIARRTRLGETADDAHKADTVTGGGAVAGTPVYMAPEQIKGGEIDARCDQFAWGVTAFELLGGERPWPEAGDMLSLVARVLTDPPRSLRQRNADVPNAVEETIVRALSKEPNARFPTMADVADALEPFATTTTGGERVRITPTAKDDPAAFAATTRVPTTVSVDSPDPATETTKKPKANPRTRFFRLFAPIALLGGLGFSVFWVKTHMRPPLVITTPTSTKSTTSPTQSARPLSTVPAAESKYKEAMSLWHDGATAKAKEALTKAIELDPSFAAAHLELAIQTSQSDPAGAQASFANAFEHRHMLTTRDAALLDASVPYVRAKPDFEEWATKMSSVVFQFPRDPELQFYLGRAQERNGEDESARSSYHSSVRLDDGFIPGLAALANVEKNLGHMKDGLDATKRCLERSPVASVCVETRYELFVANNECKKARDEAVNWRSLEPQSPWPANALARALHADNAPRPAVEEALRLKWNLLPEAIKKRQEIGDRLQLAVDDGNLAKAEELARELDATLPDGADRSDRAQPARLRINFLMEMDKMKEAAAVARAYLDRMAAWAAYPFRPDPSIDFYEPLLRAGDMTQAALAEHRQEWVRQERKRDKSPRNEWTIWMSVFGEFAETKEEALEALDRRPKAALPDAARRPLHMDFALGKSFVLAGRFDEGLPYLERVLHTCMTLDLPLLVMRAHWYKGMALEAKGDAAGAKASYEAVLKGWPDGAPSKTVKATRERLSTLTRN